MDSNGTSPWMVTAVTAAFTDFCGRELLPKERPTFYEVFVPPFILANIIVFGLLVQYLIEITKKGSRLRSAQYLNDEEEHREPEKVGDLCGEQLINVLLEEESFLSKFDEEVIWEMRMNINNIPRLLAISLPAFASLVLTGAAIMLQDTILRCLWPKVGRPDINTAITCFLAPAGLVYALSFGFMFQNAIEKQSNAMNKVTRKLSLLDQIVTMTVKLELPTRRHVMAMCKAVKSEAISMAMLVQRRKVGSFKNRTPANIKVQVWSIVDILRSAMTEAGNTLHLNTILANRTIDYIIDLNNLCTERMSTMHTCIHPVKWAFLEILGVMTLYGVMLVDAQSFIFESTINILTLYSISMLCYVLADLDSPFDGFFRVKMDVLYEVLKRAENVYNCANRGDPLDLAYVKI